MESHQEDEEFDPGFDPMEWDTPLPIVYLQDEGVFAIIVSRNAFFSRVKYTKDGTDFDVYVENEDIMDGD